MNDKLIGLIVSGIPDLSGFPVSGVRFICSRKQINKLTNQHNLNRCKHKAQTSRTSIFF